MLGGVENSLSWVHICTHVFNPINKSHDQIWFELIKVLYISFLFQSNVVQYMHKDPLRFPKIFNRFHNIQIPQHH